MAANVRVHQALLEENGSFHFHDLDGILVYISNSPFKNSIKTADGRILNYEDFAKQLKNLCQGWRLL